MLYNYDAVIARELEACDTMRSAIGEFLETKTWNTIDPRIAAVYRPRSTLVPVADDDPVAWHIPLWGDFVIEAASEHSQKAGGVSYAILDG
jgi:hypothetical protein